MLHVFEHSFGLLHPTCPSADAQVPCALITFSLPRKPDPDGHFLNLQAVTDILLRGKVGWGAGEQNICENLFYGQQPVSFCPMFHTYLSACCSVGKNQAKADSAIHQGQLCYQC